MSDNSFCGFSDGNTLSCSSGDGFWNVLQELTELISSTTVESQEFSVVLNVLERRLGLYRGMIMLLDSSKTHLIIGALADGDYTKTAMKYKKGEGIVGQVFATGKSIVVPNVSKETRFKWRVYPPEKKSTASFIAVPIIFCQETIGTMAFCLDFRTKECLETMQRFLEILASMLAHGVSSRLLTKMENDALKYENDRLKTALKDRYNLNNIIGNSGAIRKVFTQILQVAPADTTVLIRGESGTGKELVASAIHYNSKRSDAPFVRVNCAALNENLLDSELFGHEKGSFTGAISKRDGRIAEAEGGTLFLDEIGEFSQQVQVKLLRFIQERQYERIGSNKTYNANIRLVCATNCDLEKAIEEGQFRLDLYYRINVFSVLLPPLRDRTSDILLLANYFVKKYSDIMEKDVHRISTTAINMLTSYHWPGNVRELENCIEHAILVCADVIHGNNLPQTLQFPKADGMVIGSLKHRIEVLEKDVVTDAMKRNHGNVSAASRELGLTGRMVRYKLEKWDMDPKKFDIKMTYSSKKRK